MKYSRKNWKETRGGFPRRGKSARRVGFGLSTSGAFGETRGHHPNGMTPISSPLSQLAQLCGQSWIWALAQNFGVNLK